MNKPHYIQLGPSIPVVPYSHFSKTPSGVLDGCWHIVGPSVEKNLAAKAELWTIFAACYWEGLSHGVALMQQQAEESMALATGQELEKLPKQSPKILGPSLSLPLDCLNDSCYYDIINAVGD